MRTRRTNAKPHGGSRRVGCIHNILHGHFNPLIDLVQQLHSALEGVISPGHPSLSDVDLSRVRVACMRIFDTKEVLHAR